MARDLRVHFLEQRIMAAKVKMLTLLQEIRGLPKSPIGVPAESPRLDPGATSLAGNQARLRQAKA